MRSRVANSRSEASFFGPNSAFMKLSRSNELLIASIAAVEVTCSSTRTDRATTPSAEIDAQTAVGLHDGLSNR